MTPGTTTEVASSGWANPVAGRLTSPFGSRVHPVLGIVGLHAGQDIANACGTPVHAAAAGVVTWAGGPLQGRTGNQVVLAHDDGIVTRYGHLLTGSVEVAVGDRVAAGERIARMGGDTGIDPLGAGNSTGCHLHFEVNTGNGLVPIDPVGWFIRRGIALGTDEPGAVRGAPLAVASASGVASSVPAEQSEGADGEAGGQRVTLEDIESALGDTVAGGVVPVLRQLG